MYFATIYLASYLTTILGAAHCVSDICSKVKVYKIRLNAMRDEMRSYEREVLQRRKLVIREFNSLNSSPNQALYSASKTLETLNDYIVDCKKLLKKGSLDGVKDFLSLTTQSKMVHASLRGAEHPLLNWRKKMDWYLKVIDHELAKKAERNRARKPLELTDVTNTEKRNFRAAKANLPPRYRVSSN